MRPWRIHFPLVIIFLVLVWLQLLTVGQAGGLLFAALIPVLIGGVRRVNGKNVVVDRAQAIRSLAAIGYALIGVFIGMLLGLVLMMVGSYYWMTYVGPTNPILIQLPLLLFFGSIFGGGWIGFHIAKKDPMTLPAGYGATEGTPSENMAVKSANSVDNLAPNQRIPDGT